VAAAVVYLGSPNEGRQCDNSCDTVPGRFKNQLAQYRDGTTYFVEHDHLGSTRLLTRVDRSVYDSMDYLPYGEQIAGASGSTHKFTGKERDAESNLDYFGARYYSSTLGRWVSADWSAVPAPVPYADFTDPQSLNLYSYVRNLPTTKVDADGHDCTLCKDVWQGIQELVDKGTAEGQAMIAAAAAGAEKAAEISIGAATRVVAVPAIVVTYLVDPNGGHACGNGCDTIPTKPGGPSQMGAARGADEDKSQSDDARDRMRTNGGLVKPDPATGPGTVPPDQRDKKRTWTGAENDRKLDQQKGRCANCGKKLKPGEGIGHHIQRHADGGKTDDPNHAVVCTDCHVNDLHKRE
jgi:RHS repeat-associated protein